MKEDQEYVFRVHHSAFTKAIDLSYLIVIV